MAALMHNLVFNVIVSGLWSGMESISGI